MQEKEPSPDINQLLLNITENNIEQTIVTVQSFIEEKGADINKLLKNPYRDLTKNTTPIITALYLLKEHSNMLGFIKYLLEKNVDLNKTIIGPTNVKSPLMVVLELLCDLNNQELKPKVLELIKMFIEKGANVNIQYPKLRDDGHFVWGNPTESPFTFALRTENLEVLKLLLKGGLDVKAMIQPIVGEEEQPIAKLIYSSLIGEGVKRIIAPEDIDTVIKVKDNDFLVQQLLIMMKEDVILKGH